MSKVYHIFLFAVLLLLLALPAQARQDSYDSGGNKNPNPSLPATTANPQLQPSAQGAGFPDNKKTSFKRSDREEPGDPFLGNPAWASHTFKQDWKSLKPFGANLFQGYFAGTYYSGMNENYVLMPGDRLLLHIWGAQNYSSTLMIDQQGNIFLPEIGPVRVAGMRHSELQSAVNKKIAATFKKNIQVYVNLLTTQPIAVYVTGFVERPGRYAGGTNDTVLYYLDRAGGILPDRGTYRKIQIQRKNKIIAEVDLYAFILGGQISGGALQDGDVIIVGPKGGSIAAGGLIPQQATYESLEKNMTGKELIRMAMPLPAASHVSINGTRNKAPFHVYYSMDDFANFSLSAQDRVEFLADRPGETIMVSVSGSILGPTRYPVKRNITLRELLAHVPVHPTLSNLSGVYVKRKSVAEQQRKAIKDSLQRLESSVLTASSPTPEIAAIRVQEAKLVQDFAKRVANLEPDGIVVVTRNGHISDIILEEGDEIVIPQLSDVVQISGEVIMPKAVVYNKNMRLEDYVSDAGGFTDRADTDNVLVVHPNGEIIKAKLTKISGGDMLLVMPYYESKGLQIFKDIMQVLYQIAIATKVVVSM